MTIEEFTNKIAEMLKETLPEEYKNGNGVIEVSNVTKNNDVEKICITAKRKDINIAPVIYTKSFYEKYEDGEEMEEIANEIAKLITENNNPGFDADMYKDWEKVKEKVLPRIMGRTCWNEKFAEEYVHDQIEDLYIGFYVEIETEEQIRMTGSIKIKYGHLDMWGVAEEDIITQAYTNLRKHTPVVRSMFDVLKEHIPEEQLAMDDGMNILTNKKMIFGATEILNRNFMKELLDKTGDEAIYCIPSSIHEWILLKESMVTGIKEIQEMIKTVNSSMVDEEDRLSDHLYKYTEYGLESVF